MSATLKRRSARSPTFTKPDRSRPQGGRLKASLAAASTLRSTPRKRPEVIDLTGMDSDADPGSDSKISPQGPRRVLFPHATDRQRKTGRAVAGRESSARPSKPSISTAPAKMGNAKSKLAAAVAGPAPRVSSSSADEWSLPSSPTERLVAKRQAAADASQAEARTEAVSVDAERKRIPPSPAPDKTKSGRAGPEVQPAPAPDSSTGPIFIDLTGEPSSSEDESDDELPPHAPPISSGGVDLPLQAPIPPVQWSGFAGLDVHREIPSPATSIGSSVISVDGGSRYSSGEAGAEVDISDERAEEPELVGEDRLPDPPSEAYRPTAIGGATSTQDPSSSASPALAAQPRAEPSPPRLSLSYICCVELAPIASPEVKLDVKQKPREEEEETNKTQSEPVRNGDSENGSDEPYGSLKPVEESPTPSTPEALISSAIKRSARTPEKRKQQAVLLEMLELHDSASSNSEDEWQRKSQLVGGTKYVVDEAAWASSRSRKQARRTGIPPIIPTKMPPPTPPKVTRQDLLRMGKEAGIKTKWLSPVIGKKSRKLEGRSDVVTIGSGCRHRPEVDGVGNLSADLWQDRERKRRHQESVERREKRQAAANELLDCLYLTANVGAEPDNLAPTASPKKGRSGKVGPSTVASDSAKGETANAVSAPQSSTKRRRNSDRADDSLSPVKKPRFAKEREDDEAKEDLARRRVRASTPAPDEWVTRRRRQSPTVEDDDAQDLPTAFSDNGSSGEDEEDTANDLAARRARASTPAPDDWIKRFRREAPPVTSAGTDAGHARGIGSSRAKRAARQTAAGTPDSNDRVEGRAHQQPSTTSPDGGHVVPDPGSGKGSSGRKKKKKGHVVGSSTARTTTGRAATEDVPHGVKFDAAQADSKNKKNRNWGKRNRNIVRKKMKRREGVRSNPSGTPRT
ncbi:hypothetical protein MAPG_11345 [Magnaporthiopsis poae ATCC 64411]|uniref:Uncharacterized protein n=1 Tax=Magnaporthiopsis poae (strain ATCC 64411 / 73-15) TaxID=644358 RepID=A0A0C4EF10_MAGP6|nr:hypothetical protein MAPG_11345 [Magnaporthiopsis poae ATCC 64411]